MNKRREAAALLLAVLLFGAVTWCAAWLLMPVRTQYGSDWEQFLQEDAGSCDVLLFGSSLVYCDVAPAFLWEETGLSAYVLAGPEQTIPTSYYYVRQAFETQSPQLVVLEATGMFYPRYTNYTKANIGYMPMGRSRLAATFFAAEREERFGLLFPLYNYHYRWQDATAEDLSGHLFPSAGLTAGYTLLTEHCPPPQQQVRDYTASGDNYHRNLTYVEKLRDLCADRGAQLLLYIAPSAGKIPADALKTLEGDLAARDVALADFNRELPRMGIDDNTDWYDFLHFNLRGAEKFTRFLAGWLEEHYGLEPKGCDAALWQRRLDHLNSALYN